MNADNRERTGRLSPLLPSLDALNAGSETVHAAEEIRLPYYNGHYPDFIALCGEQGWGAAGDTWRGATAADLERVNCKRCKVTTRWRTR